MSPTRPRVRLHWGQSLDGKAHAEGLGRRALGGPADARAMQRARALADAVLVGAETVRAHDVPMRLRPAGAIAARRAQGRPAQPLPVVLAQSGRLAPNARVFAERDADGPLPWVVVGPQAHARAAAELAGRADVLALGCCCTSPAHPDSAACLPALLARLAAHGVRRLLVEGGGTTTWAFVEAGLVDEVWCTVAPCLLGGVGRPTPVAGVGLTFPGRVRLALRRVQVAGDLLLLRYRVSLCRRS